MNYLSRVPRGRQLKAAATKNKHSKRNEDLEEDEVVLLLGFNHQDQMDLRSLIMAMGKDVLFGPNCDGAQVPTHILTNADCFLDPLIKQQRASALQTFPDAINCVLLRGAGETGVTPSLVPPVPSSPMGVTASLEAIGFRLLSLV